ncbi:glycosyltransferase family 2 protein [Oxynema sp. CENA135]|uniref:hormogonium polysaccharide biosynthesis glycosyltransferase HpsE n=1 Tax=Oxynema sp. CENA135 TaxID=984206 RepID=UPI00190B4574|nr:hormogonium polysaccharide biosynthesis glycosyltransferase HpsE [Oxynema sp. CENA135]MBK4732788.1 glycosyltransferase family 2 protein [Oxynema sp. CENA135]
MVDFTVAICTYNGANRLPEVLESLKKQVNTEGFSWEVIVIDNNSNDDTPQAIAIARETWPASIPFYAYFESQQGAGFARKKAICEARSPLIGFLDDDNLPEPNWVAAAVQFAREHPQAGAYGSQIHGAFEAEPPPNFRRIQSLFAIIERGSQPLCYDPKSNLLPPSAGLVVRKQAWLDNVPERCILSGRIPGSMLTSEDLEVLSYIQKSDWEIWYNPAMEIYHKIGRSRLQRAYLLPFLRGIGLSRYVTRMVRIPPSLRPLAAIVYMVNDLRKIFQYLLKYRTKIKNDLITEGEFELLTSSFISPFYLWKHGYLKKESSIP